jgi:hypothetical protein
MTQEEFLKLIERILKELDEYDYTEVIEKYYDQLKIILVSPVEVHHLMQSLYAFKMNNKN